MLLGLTTVQHYSIACDVGTCNGPVTCIKMDVLGGSGPRSVLHQLYLSFVPLIFNKNVTRYGKYVTSYFSDQQIGQQEVSGILTLLPDSINTRITIVQGNDICLKDSSQSAR